MSPAIRRLPGASLERWLGMPEARAACVGHFVALAATLATAKVLLATIGVALFLANEGAARLPLFYMVLAAVAIVMSSVLGAVVDRGRRIRLAQVAFVGVLTGAAALRLLIASDLPGVYFMLLASAHIFEIVVDIVFWVVVAAYLDSVELKRATPLIYMALAVGGAIGGALARAFSTVLAPADLLVLLLLLAAAVAAQCAAAARHLSELPDSERDQDERDDGLHRLSQLGQLIRGYPLSVLIALNALVLTILYGLSEYLVFSIYSAEFPEEQALTRFLAVVFAGLQVVEFGLLYAVTRPLLQRVGPIGRNLVFPLSSLACLVYLAASQKLTAAVVTHVNAEAVSNAIFQPVNNTNYVPLPLRFQGRARTLADGVFYPSGLALAGAMLLGLQGEAAMVRIGFVAIVFALVFAALNVGVGLLFLPTLHRNLRSGFVHFGDLVRRTGLLPASLIDRVRRLLESADPERRAVGLGLARRVDPALVLDQLRALAPGADRTTRRALVEVLTRTTARDARTLVDELLRGDDDAGRLVALEVALARPEVVSPGRVGHLRTSTDPSVRALARLATIDPASARAVSEAGPEVAGLLRDPDVLAEVVDAIGHARRGDLARLVAPALVAAPPALSGRGLAVLRDLAPKDCAEAGDVARRLLDHRWPAVRAEAVACLAAVEPSEATFDEVAQRLADPGATVRRRAAAVLVAEGDAATDLLAAELVGAGPGASDAAWALARIGSRRARRALATYLQRAGEDVGRNLDLRHRLAARPDRAAWSALEFALEDQDARLFDLVMNILAGSGEGQLVDRLRQALRAEDQRIRANAFEALRSLPDRHVVDPITAILDRMLIDDHVPPPAGQSVPADAEILTIAADSADPWVRQAVRQTAPRMTRQTSPAPAKRAPPPDRSKGTAMTPNEHDVERIVTLKRVPLFRYLPLDTLLAVSRVLESRSYRAGREIMAAGARADHLYVVETGKVEIDSGWRSERLGPAACFGELALIGELPTFRRVVAIEDSSLLRLHRVVFEDLSRDHPEILVELSRLLARQLRQLHDGAQRERA